MRFVQNYLEGIAGVSIYPLISFAVFFLFFIVVTWYVIVADRRQIDHMANLPLNNTEPADA